MKIPSLEFLLWCSGISSISAALGPRFQLVLAQGVKDLVFDASCGSDLIPGLGTLYAKKQPKKKKKKKRSILFEQRHEERHVLIAIVTLSYFNFWGASYT